MSTNWRDEAKALEQRLMIVQDHYAVARALGSPAAGFWGDPIETHAEILRRVEQLAEIERLRSAIEAIRQATIEGRACDDVAWFGTITTPHDFCEQTLSPSV